MPPELKSSREKKPTVQERAIEEPMAIVLSNRALSHHPERVTNVAMKAGRIVDIFETIEPFEGEVVDDGEDR